MYTLVFADWMPSKMHPTNKTSKLQKVQKKHLKTQTFGGRVHRKHHHQLVRVYAGHRTQNTELLACLWEPCTAEAVFSDTLFICKAYFNIRQPCSPLYPREDGHRGRRLQAQWLSLRWTKPVQNYTHALTGSETCLRVTLPCKSNSNFLTRHGGWAESALLLLGFWNLSQTPMG